MKNSLFSFLVVVLISACAQKQDVEIHSTINDLDDTHYAQITIGDSASVILDTFNDSLILSNSQEILFTSKTKDSRVQKREIRAAIDRDLIYEISIDFYLKQDSLVQPFFNECKTKLDLLYGKSQMDEGYAGWNTPSIHKKVIEIELFDESINTDLKMVTINFYEDFDKSFYAE